MASNESTKRILRYLLPVIPIIFIILCFENYRRVDVCWQCGARKSTSFFQHIFNSYSVIENPISKRAESILGYNCPHRRWQMDWFNGFIGHGDTFASRKVPIIMYLPERGDLINYIEILPEKDWRKKALLAIGDPQNRLKYVATSVLYILGTDLKPAEKKWTDEQWKQWWLENNGYFQKVTDVDQAREIAKQFSDLVERINPAIKSDISYDWVNAKLGCDLETRKDICP
jgi:hypothetical protein